MPNNRLDLNELKGIAVKDGGKLLSRKYNFKRTINFKNLYL